MLVSSCLPPEAGLQSTASDVESGVDSPVLSPADVILREETAVLFAGELSFSRLKEGMLKEAGVRALLEVEFSPSTAFSLHHFAIAMNGGLGHYSEAFDLNRISRWAISHDRAVLSVEVGKLDFEGDRSFFNQALRVQSRKGRVSLWFISPLCKMIKARLLLVRSSPAHSVPGLMTVAWDQVPTIKTDRFAVQFAFHSPEGAPLFFECAKDKAAFKRCETPKRYSDMGLGNHTVFVRAVDVLKRRGPYLSYSFEVVKWNGTITVSQVEPAKSPTSSTSMRLWFHSSSERNNRQLVCRLDESAFAPCASPVTFHGVGEGLHEAQLQWRNLKNGNLIDDPTSFAWVVDRTAPQVQFRDAPSPLSQETSAYFSWIVSEESSFLCILDHGEEVACQSPLEIDQLAKGAHLLQLKGVDLAGNASEVNEYAWTVDIEPPKISIGSIAPAEDLSPSTSFQVSFSANKPALFQCRLDQDEIEGCVSPFHVDALGEGEHLFEIMAIDAAGNFSEGFSHRWAIDTTRPQVIVQRLFPAKSPSLVNEASFSLESADSVRFYCDLDQSGARLCVPPVSYNNLVEGTHQLLVTSVDGAGNASEPVLSQWEVDRTAPLLSWNGVFPAESPTSSRSLLLEFVSNESGMTLCELDSGGKSACLSPVALNGLADGVHHFSVQSQDEAGNISEPIAYAWEIQSIPLVTLDLVTPLEPVTALTQIELQFSSNLPSSFECRLDSGAFQVCSSPWLLEGLASQVHLVEIHAVNNAGVAGPSVVHSWEIDALPPQLMFLSADPIDPVTSLRNISLSFTSESGASFFCKLDNGGEVECSSPWSLSDLTEGTHKVVILALDILGNRSVPYEYRWTVDTASPQAEIVSRLPGGSPSQSRSISVVFTSNESDVEFFCALDDRAFASCTSPFFGDGLVDGAHTFKVWAQDRAGNRSSTVSDAWGVDATPATITLVYRTPAESLTASRQIEVGFSANEGAFFTCSLDGGAAAPCSSPYRAAALTDAMHSVEIRAFDTAGNNSEPVTTSWQVDASSPVVTILTRAPAGVLTNNKNLNTTFSANEIAQFFCSLDNQAPISCQSPFSASNLLDGNHLFQVSAKDSAGNESVAISFGWAIDTIRPLVTSLTHNPSPPVVSTRAVSLLFSGSEVGTFHCALDGAPAQPCSSPFALTQLSEGVHQVSVYLVDTAENISDLSSLSWSVDTLAPVIQGYSRNPSDSLSSARSFTLSFAANENGVAFFCSLDGGVTQSCSSPLQVANLADGSHSFQVFALDLAGNQSNPVMDAWNVDGTAPLMNLVARIPSGSLVNSRSLAVQFSSNKPGNFFCSLDSGAFVSCSSPFSAANLSDGTHTFRVYVKDLAGNQSSTASDTWTVDATAPIASLTSRSPGAPLVSSRSVSISFQSNEQASVFQCALDGGSFSICSSPFGALNLIDGAHSFQVFAKDSAGNQSALVLDSWTIDATSPGISLIARNPSGSLVVSRSVSVIFSSNDGSAFFQCSLDGQAFGSCASPFTANQLADGAHSFQVFAVDSAGNQSIPATDSWTVDATAPIASITSRTPAGSVITSRNISLTFVSNEAGSLFQCSLDGQSFTSCSSPYNAANLFDGVHGFQVFAQDAAGNGGGIATAFWSIDATAPTVTLSSRTPSGSLVTSKTVSVVFGSNDAGSVFQCALDGAPFNSCSSPFSGSNLGDGAHSFQVFAKDSVGNQSSTVFDSWTVDATAPLVALTSRTPSGSLVTSKSISLSFTSNDGGSVFQCSLDGGEFFACASPFSASNLAEGGHSFQLVAKDAAGNQSAIASDSWTIDAIAPVATLSSRTPGGSLVNSKGVTIVFNSNEGGALLYCSLDGQVPSVCASPFSASDLSDGNHTFQVYAKDAAGNQSAPVSTTWAIDATAPVTSLGSRIPSANLVNSKGVSISFSANEGGSNFQCSLDGAAFSSCNSPFSASNLADGLHSFLVFAKDLANNPGNTVSDSWTVDTVAPVIFFGTVIPSYSPSISTSKNIAFSASESASFRCFYDNGAFSACSSPFNVQNLVEGTHSLAVAALDLAGNQGAPSTLTWEVNTAALTTSSVSIGQVAQTTAQVSWVTSIPANSRVIYGAGANLNLSTTLDPANVTNHGVTLTGLVHFTVYSVQTISIDPDGRETRSSARTFRTAN